MVRKVNRRFMVNLRSLKFIHAFNKYGRLIELDKLYISARVPAIGDKIS